MAYIIINQYEIQDLMGGEYLKNQSALELRKQIDILVIDDDEFAVGKSLEKNNFRLTYKKSIENVRELSDYPLILCDIRGVGSNFSPRYEGAFIIKEIKVNYPTKQVVAYTGSPYDPSYNNYLSYADALIKKGLEVEEWIEILDEEIQKCTDPINQWKKVRNRLLHENVSISEVSKLESAYVKAIKKKDFDGFEKLANKMSAGNGKLISELLSSIAVKLIKG